ncbi:MAG: hypothetical protein R6W85_03185 [Gillisia sp.]
MFKLSLIRFTLFLKTLKFSLLFFSIIAFTSCSIPGLVNPDSYGRDHQVYAVDFEPENLSSINISKMNKGTWEDAGKVLNNQNARFSISIEANYLIVEANKAKMDLPTYQTWLNYARQQLGYTMDSEYDVFDTVKEGWIYEIDLDKFPLINEENHRILMYEFN